MIIISLIDDVTQNHSKPDSRNRHTQGSEYGIIHKKRMLIMKSYVHNVILVMSGGSGARFGADCPKQYSRMKNRMVIDYVMDACRKTRGVDAIVIVAAKEYSEFCANRYRVPTVCGGATRPESVANGLRFIHENYDCRKLIITNAVCPLATSEQYARYFKALDDYDYVLTTWKLAPALHRFDGQKCDRDEFFNVMEPDAYRFPVLFENFNFAKMHKYIFHNMPNDSKPFFCMDYPYTMKLTHPHDLKPLIALYDEIVMEPEKNETYQTVNNFLSAGGKSDVVKWISNVQRYIIEFASRYRLTSYAINSQTEENIVFEANSEIHGDVIIKFTPSAGNFHKEYVYYSLAKKENMAELIDADPDYCALVLKMVKPGFQVSINPDNPHITNFFTNISNSMIPIAALNNDSSVPNVLDEFFLFQESANRFTFEYEFRKSMERKALLVWDSYFKNSPKFYLHRDLHQRNLLMSENGIRAIDPRGAIGPKAFEFVIQFVIELRDSSGDFDINRFNRLFSFFSKFINKDELRAALFIFLVYKMNDYVFQKNDGFKLATWCKTAILTLFFRDNEDPIDNRVMPTSLEKFL